MLKEFFKFDKKDSLIRVSLLFFIANFIYHTFNFVFHFYMGRALGPENYGVLGVVMSIIYVVSIPIIILQTGVSKFVAEYKAKNEEKKINVLFRNILFKFTIVSVILVLFYVLVSPLLASFLHVSTIVMIALAPFLLIFLVLSSSRGLLQGLQNFKALGFNMVLESVSKLIIGIILVAVGFGVIGAIASIDIGVFLALMFLIIVLIKYLPKTKEKIDFKSVYMFTLPLIVGLVILTMYYTVDLFLVKHFFTELEAGYYAALSLLGKIIFFATVAIGMVMFPKLAEAKVLKKSLKKILSKSMILVSIACVGALVVYFLLPKLMVWVLFGEGYLEIAKYLGVFGLFISFISLNYTLLLYQFALKKFKLIWLLLLFLILEIVLIYFYHSTLWQVIWIILGLMFVLFLILMFISYKGKK